MQPVIAATALSFTSDQQQVFGPLNLAVDAGKLCLITAENASGKSSLLLALSGRLQGVKGKLLINGVNAQTSPYKAIAQTSIAQLGNYIAPEDRLTVAEAIADRAYIDGITVETAFRRFEHLSRVMGFSLAENAKLESYDLLTQRWLSVVLAVLRPAKAVFLDDADTDLTPAQATTLYQLLLKLAEAEEMAVIASGKLLSCAPAGTLYLQLASKQQSPVPYQSLDTEKLTEKTSAAPESMPLSQLPDNEALLKDDLTAQPDAMASENALPNEKK
ncbi:MAG: ATP-binding cassette domain-containing protein [Actinomycetaceae bacterium]|nr:ATP-binding cassette domain-containing protein [Actinomycetaceae bacterium]